MDKHLPERWSGQRLALQIGSLALWLTLFGGWAVAAEPCGRYWGFGFTTELRGDEIRQQLAMDRSFTPTFELSDAPSAPLPIQPLLFVDGALNLDHPAIKLPCRDTVRLAWHDLSVEHSLHWLFMTLPLVPERFLLTPVEKLWRDLEQLPAPGIRPMFFQEIIRPSPSDVHAGMEEEATAATPPLSPDPAVQVGPGERLELDEVRWVEVEGVLEAADLTAARTIARTALGREITFELRFYVSEASVGPLLVTCLLDLEQIAPFNGRMLVPIEAHFDTTITVTGTVRAERLGWSRLQCFMLADDPELDTVAHWPRPINAAYLLVE
jgi:hypothetical protein